MLLSELSASLNILGRELNAAGKSTPAKACAALIKQLTGLPECPLDQLAEILIRLQSSKKTATKSSVSAIPKPSTAPKKAAGGDSAAVLEQKFTKLQSDAQSGNLNTSELRQFESLLKAVSFPGIKDFCKATGYSPSKTKAATIKFFVDALSLNQQRAYRQ